MTYQYQMNIKNKISKCYDDDGRFMVFTANVMPFSWPNFIS